MSTNAPTPTEASTTDAPNPAALSEAFLDVCDNAVNGLQPKIPGIMRETGGWRGWKRWIALLLSVSPLAGAVQWQVDPQAKPGGDGSPDRPFAMLSDAVAALPAAPQEPLTLILADGVHRIHQPLVLGPTELRGQPLTIRGEEGAVVSGGRPLTDWRVEDGRWVHPWDGGPIRELFVDGRRAPRSRFPASGWLRMEKSLPDKRSGFTSQDELPDWEPGLELLFLHDWSVSRVPVVSIEGRLLKSGGPIGFPAPHFVIDHFEPHPRFCLENGLAFLTEPGTWCHDPAGKRLVYLPRAGESSSATDMLVPAATQLLHIAGEVGKRVADVRVEGITFRHCRYDIEPQGYAEAQATKYVPRDQPPGEGDVMQQWRFVPWAVEVEWAERVAFADCRFEQLGGSGVLLGAGTRDCALERCVVRDVSGNGAGLGEGGERRLEDGRSWIHRPEQVAKGNRIEHCRISHCGQQFHGAVGIWAGLVKDARITRNTVEQLPYTGISVGWKWDAKPTPCGGNRVEGNHIHHVMQLLSDGGGIYTLGRQPGTVLRDNHIHHIPLNLGRAESNGIFLDQGSSEFVIERNLIHHTDRSPLRFHRAGPLEVRDNAWLLPPGIPALRFNNTNPAIIDAHDNRALDAASLEAERGRWPER